jgi:hypothetical protein
VLKNGETVTDRSKLKENDEVTIRFGDFAVNAIITGFADI